MSWPSSSTWPATRAPGTTSCRRLSERRNVDFPHPEGPMTAVTCLGSTVMLTSASAWNDPNQASRCSTSMRFAMGVSRSDKPVAAGEKAGDDGEKEDDEDQRKGTGPCPVHGHLERRAGLGEDEERQRRLRPLERVRADGVEPEGGQQQRRRLPGHPGDGQ